MSSRFQLACSNARTGGVRVVEKKRKTDGPSAVIVDKWDTYLLGGEYSEKPAAIIFHGFPLYASYWREEAYDLP